MGTNGSGTSHGVPPSSVFLLPRERDPRANREGGHGLPSLSCLRREELLAYFCACHFEEHAAIVTQVILHCEATHAHTTYRFNMDANYYIRNNPFKKQERHAAARLQWIIGE